MLVGVGLLRWDMIFLEFLVVQLHKIEDGSVMGRANVASFCFRVLK